MSARRRTRFFLGFVLAAAACVSDNPVVPGSDTGTDAPVVPPDGGSETSSPVDAGPDATPPPNVPGVVLWLDATRGVTEASGKLSKWADQSGNNNDATPPYTAASPAVTKPGINGLPSISFDGATHILRVPDATTLRLGTGDFTLEVVLRHTLPQPSSPSDPFGYSPIVNKRNNNISLQGMLLWMNYPNPPSTKISGEVSESPTTLMRVSSQAGNYNDNVARFIGFRRVSGTIELRINGAVDATTPDAGQTIDAPGVDFNIGARLPTPDASTVIQPFRGDLSEVILVKGIISPANLDNLEKYLKTKYGL